MTQQEFERIADNCTTGTFRKRFGAYWKGKLMTFYSSKNVWISEGTAKKALRKNLYQKDNSMIDAYIASGELEIRRI